MDWFVYDTNLRHESVNIDFKNAIKMSKKIFSVLDNYI